MTECKKPDQIVEACDKILERVKFCFTRTRTIGPIKQARFKNVKIIFQ